MIVVQDVYKRYQTAHGPGPWVLEGVNFTLPRGRHQAPVAGVGAAEAPVAAVVATTQHSPVAD